MSHQIINSISVLFQNQTLWFSDSISLQFEDHSPLPILNENKVPRRFESSMTPNKIRVVIASNN